MNGTDKRYLIDSNIIIYHLNGVKIASDFLKEISLQCLKNRDIKKIKLPDNLIASTAQVYNLILVSRNIKDFENLEIEVLNIFL